MDNGLKFILDLLYKLYIGFCFIFGFWYITLKIIHEIIKKVSKYFNKKYQNKSL